jgi:hypothetical protein
MRIGSLPVVLIFFFFWKTLYFQEATISARRLGDLPAGLTSGTDVGVVWCSG